MKIKLLLVLVLGWLFASSQDTIRMMQYNLLMFGDNFGGCTSTNNNVNDKNEYLKTIVDFVKPDIVMVNELYKDSYFHDLILDNVFNANGGSSFSRGNPPNYSNGYTVNEIFYNNEKLTLLGSTAIHTKLLDIDIFNLQYQPSSQKAAIPLHCAVAHLKAGNSDENAAERAAETEKLMDYLNDNNAEGNYTMSGDFNVYTASETAFQNLVFNANTDIRFYDPLNQLGSWNNNNFYSAIHTQSTHTSGDCYSGGGLDDRFDFILLSDEILDGSQKIAYLSGSYHAIGQDGQHFNHSLNSSPTNSSVPTDVLNALYHMSDHLPVMIDLVFDNSLSVDNTMTSQASLSLENPVGNTLHLHLISEPGQSIRFKLLNSFGQMLLEQEYYSTGSLNATINTSDYKNGLYIIQFFFAKELPLERKVVIKH